MSKIDDAILAIKYNYPTDGYTMLKEGLDLAIEVLEKQIPKKPTKTYEVIAEYKLFGECPNCGHTGLKQNTHVHCWWCGQAIDWSEGKDNGSLQST